MRVTAAVLAGNSKLAALVAAALARDGIDRAPSASRMPAPVYRNEADLHRAIFDMIEAERGPAVIALHVPNGGARSKAEAGKLKSMGTVAGAPDLLVIVRGRVYGLEIKTDAGRLSAAQKAMATRFRRAGSEYEVARSVEGARALLRRWGAITGAAT